MMTEWQRDMATVVGLALAVFQVLAVLFSFAVSPGITFEEWQQRRMHDRKMVGLLFAFLGFCIISELIVVLLCAGFWLFGAPSGLAPLRLATIIQVLLAFVLFMHIYRKDNYSWRLSLLAGGFCCSVLALGAVVSKDASPTLLEVFVQQVDSLKLPVVGILLASAW